MNGRADVNRASLVDTAHCSEEERGPSCVNYSCDEEELSSLITSGTKIQGPTPFQDGMHISCLYSWSSFRLRSSYKKHSNTQAKNIIAASPSAAGNNSYSILPASFYIQFFFYSKFLQFVPQQVMFGGFIAVEVLQHQDLLIFGSSSGQVWTVHVGRNILSQFINFYKNTSSFP